MIDANGTPETVHSAAYDILSSIICVKKQLAPPSLSTPTTQPQLTSTQDTLVANEEREIKELKGIFVIFCILWLASVMLASAAAPSMLPKSNLSNLSSSIIIPAIEIPSVKPYSPSSNSAKNRSANVQSNASSGGNLSKSDGPIEQIAPIVDNSIDRQTIGVALNLPTSLRPITPSKEREVNAVSQQQKPHPFVASSISSANGQDRLSSMESMAVSAGSTSKSSASIVTNFGVVVNAEAIQQTTVETTKPPALYGGKMPSQEFVFVLADGISLL